MHMFVPRGRGWGRATVMEMERVAQELGQNAPTLEQLGGSPWPRRGSSPQLAPEKITFPRLTIRRTLRFGVGERTECKTGKKEWSAGEVVALMFHDKESMPVGQVVPYQIKLDDGTLIYAPSDKDAVIRKA